LQGLGSDLAEAPNSLATQTILAKRIIEMVDQGLRDIPALLDDALAFLQHSPPSASRNGLGEAIRAQTAPLPIPKLLRFLAAKSLKATKVEPVQLTPGNFRTIRCASEMPSGDALRTLHQRWSVTPKRSAIRREAPRPVPSNTSWRSRSRSAMRGVLFLQSVR
jgi:hypothetical protein